MSLKVPLNGCGFWLDLFRTVLQGRQIRLYKNDKTPLDADVRTDYTEADFTGYAAQTSTPWSTPVPDTHGRMITTGAMVTFNQTSGSIANTVYGYYILDNLEGDTVLYAERFTAPIAMNASGLFIDITPKMTMRSEF